MVPKPHFEISLFRKRGQKVLKNGGGLFDIAVLELNKTITIKQYKHKHPYSLNFTIPNISLV